jgi:hypothetical protein
MSVSNEDILRELKAAKRPALNSKSTLRWYLKAGRNHDDIFHAAMKAIAGFLNKDSGVVYIGVDPDGNPRGLTDDGYKNDDKFALLVIDLVKQYLGHSAAISVHLSFHDIDGKRGSHAARSANSMIIASACRATPRLLLRTMNPSCRLDDRFNRLREAALDSIATPQIPDAFGLHFGTLDHSWRDGIAGRTTTRSVAQFCGVSTKPR